MILLSAMLLTPVLSFARIHEDCHTYNKVNRDFAIGYTGAVIDLRVNNAVEGRGVYKSLALNYEQAFGEVCKVIDEHPELWNCPSRDAVTFAVNVLWKKKD
jgi:hypothetical protein